MPVIGITICRKLEDYRQSVLHAGGDVVVLESGSDPAAAVDRIDGLLLTGGGDVDPALYGEAAHKGNEPAEPGRDAFEIGLVREARRRQLPVFAICRGVQVLNVAAGGKLVQDIPSEVPGALRHDFNVPQHHPSELAHEVWIEKETLLGRLLGERLDNADTCDVNSRHHQAVAQVAPGFKVSATAPDGVVEAIEDPQAPFCLGVQWHPENFWRTGEFRPLFEAFIDAATNRPR